ncbi:hypothetical protein VTK73DRAFT_4234 [Phialemonium thermophilum]|uniref:Secreted peptide n=1 Tax=Phialemonium thermophilum TaxID=223376 RepID=A0ABR3VAQ8_9PEZI
MVKRGTRSWIFFFFFPSVMMGVSVAAASATRRAYYSCPNLCVSCVLLPFSFACVCPFLRSILHTSRSVRCLSHSDVDSGVCPHISSIYA